MSYLTKFKIVSNIVRRLFSTQTTFPPGLRLIENFLPAPTENILRTKSLELVKQINESMQHPFQIIKTTTYLSKQHNLTTDEFYHKIRVSDEDGKKLDAQHFAKYGDEGHSLTYFIGHSNIPHYVKSQLIPALNQLHPPLHEPSSTSTSRPIDWKFSFNIYRAINTQRAGFPWHIDTPSNGAVTAIYTLLSEAQMELKRPEDNTAVHNITLPPNSLLILGGEARWNCQRRVLSENNAEIIPADEARVKRLSLVLGRQ